MSTPQTAPDARVAVLVDCDNTSPEILEYALRVVAQFGRVVLRRGYGNHTTLANKWQEALVRLAFTPCLQYQYAAGKNTSDIALALDAMEAMFDQRADTYCLVTSDSDFAYLCRKLRERGATVCIVGSLNPPMRCEMPVTSFLSGFGQMRQRCKAQNIHLRSLTIRCIPMALSQKSSSPRLLSNAGLASWLKP